MKRLNILLSALCMLLAVTVALPAAAQATGQQTSVKQERNHIRSGNKLYNAKKYAEAEVEYRKALQANQRSVVGQYNLALALIRQAGGDANGKDNPAVQAAQLFMNVIKASDGNKLLQSRAFHNLGNIAYGSQRYEDAIGYYKDALRRNPYDEDARYNLRKAQLKLQEQKQNKNNDKNKNKNNDKKDNDKQKQNQQDKSKQNQQDKQQQQQGGMSQQNVDQILKAMQDEERATQQRMNAARQQMQRGERERTRNKW